MAKAVNPRSDKNLARRAAIALLDSTVSSTPGLAQAWALSKALYGNALELRQERALEWVEMVRDNPEIFSRSLLESEAFQDGFVVALEDYVKLRLEDKREIARRIFLEFAVSPNKLEFQLERYNDTLQKISTASLNLLAFLNQTIMPLKEKMVKQQLAKDNLGTEKPYEWWLELKMKREPLSKYLDQWLHDKYNPNSPKLIKKYGVNGSVQQPKLTELFDIERAKREEYYAPMSELEYLGLVSEGMQPSGGWSSVAAMSWTLTDFAVNFIKFVNE